MFFVPDLERDEANFLSDAAAIASSDTAQQRGCVEVINDISVGDGWEGYGGGGGGGGGQPARNCHAQLRRRKSAWKSTFRCQRD
mmetsp:Transcript_67306/g.140614  ORF Transcript_67306/g.140614 Transcript_67306/m.140614 type:complete len:84 (+) Transcript_67306:765-1016(+)